MRTHRRPRGCDPVPSERGPPKCAGGEWRSGTRPGRRRREHSADFRPPKKRPSAYRWHHVKARAAAIRMVASLAAAGILPESGLSFA